MEPNQRIGRLLESRAALPVMMAVAAAIGLGAAWFWSPTYDESNHLEMGRRILQRWDFSRFDNSKMPVSLFNALGWSLADGGRVGWWLARLPQIGWLLGTAAVVARWGTRIGGRAAGAIAAGFVLFDPNLLAHSALVTTDAPCTFFVVLTSYLTWRALVDGGRKRWLLAGAIFGVAQAAKFTSVFLAPIVAIIWLAATLLRGGWRRNLVGAAIFSAAALVTLNSSYSWQGSFTRSSEIEWRSSTFAPLADVDLPLPFPRPWVEGLDWVKSDDDQGHGNIYLNGEMTPKGRDDYYLSAMGRKFPLPLLILAPLGLFWRRDGEREPLEKSALLAAPAFLLAWFSFAFNFQLGLRYILPVVPFFALLTARLPTRVSFWGLPLLLASTLSWWPWGLSYTNELTPRLEGWRYLADSNIDWGQGEYEVERWKAENEGGPFNPPVPLPGPSLLSANALTGVLGDPGRFECLREHLPPTEVIAAHLYPYDLTLAELEACFPSVSPPPVEEGGFAAGEHLVALRFRGQGALQIGEWREEARSDAEVVIAAVVKAEGRFDIVVEHEGADVALFIDGVRTELPVAIAPEPVAPAEELEEGASEGLPSP